MKFNRNIANPWGESSSESRGNEKHCEIDAHVSNNVSHAIGDTPSVLILRYLQKYHGKKEKER